MAVPLHIYLSHSRADGPAARDIAAAIASYGGKDITVNMTQDLPPGADEARVMQKLDENQLVPIAL
jgi:hypothetical protein